VENFFKRNVNFLVKYFVSFYKYTSGHGKLVHCCCCCCCYYYYYYYYYYWNTTHKINVRKIRGQQIWRQNE